MQGWAAKTPTLGACQDERGYPHHRWVFRDLGRPKHGAQGEARAFSAGSVLWLLLLSQMVGWGDQSPTAELELRGMMSGRRIPVAKMQVRRINVYLSMPCGKVDEGQCG